jgi:hypothetical protein
MKKENKSDCQQAQFFYFDYLTKQSSSASALWFEHIEHCPQCQREIKRLENEICRKPGALDTQSPILALHHRHLSKRTECDAVKPFLASLAHPELSIRTETPITAHIARCPLCRKDLQTITSLHLSDRQLVEATQILSDEPRETGNLSEQVAAAIRAIRDRKSSGIATRLEIDTEGETHVQVESRFIQSRSLAQFSAAAAILLIASLVFFRTTLASGISLQAVYHALTSPVNCRIQINVPEQKNPIQTILISKKLNLVAYQQDSGVILLDIQHHKVFCPGQKNDAISKQFEQEIWSKISRAEFGLLPFETIHQIPAGYVWKRQDNLSQDPSWEIYDLSWKEHTGTGIIIEKTWRGYLLNGSHLPVRIQWLEKQPEQMEKSVVTEITIEYPDTQTVLNELKEKPFHYSPEGDHIK